MRGQERQEETVERLEPLGAGSGAADIEYEQFMKAKEVQRAMFQARLLKQQGTGSRLGPDASIFDNYSSIAISSTDVCLMFDAIGFIVSVSIPGFSTLFLFLFWLG